SRLTIHRCSLIGHPTSEMYTLSLHDALPISVAGLKVRPTTWKNGAGPIASCASGIRSLKYALLSAGNGSTRSWPIATSAGPGSRSEEHTSELQSREKLVCRLLLEKKTSEIEA